MGVFKRAINNKDDKRKEYWYIDYVIDGKRKWESVGAIGEVGKENAKKLLALRKTEILQGKFDAPKPKVIPTFSEFAKEYLEFAKGNKKAWDRDMYALRSLEPFFGTYKLSEISPIIVEKYKLERKQAVSTETVNKELSILRRIFNVAISWDKCKSNPVNKVKFFKESPPKERILSLEEERTLLESSPNHIRPILITALNTGMRYRELLDLTWNDVDLDSSYILVRKSKSGKDRKIPINETLRETLLDLRLPNSVSKSVSRDYVAEEKTNDYQVVTETRNCLEGAVPAMACGFDSRLRHHKPSDKVFTYKGNPLKKIRNAFLLSCKRANIKNLRFHDLRHAFATRLVLSGVDLATVFKLCCRTPCPPFTPFYYGS